jgi:hypothetical protein
MGSQLGEIQEECTDLGTGLVCENNEFSHQKLQFDDKEERTCIQNLN